MELRQLRYFVAVARELNFHTAARSLNISQPPLSYQIKQLEAELRVRLFNRTKRSVELTQAGRLFLVEAENTLSTALRAKEVVRKQGKDEVGSLTVSCMSSSDVLIVPKIVVPFMRRYPAVQISLRTMNEIDQIEGIEKGEVDVGFSTLPTGFSGDCVIEPLYHEPYVTVLPEGHRLGRRTKIPFAALSDEPWIMPDRRYTPSSYFMIMSRCLAAGFTPRIVQYCQHVQVMFSLIAAGVGVAILPKRVELLPRRGVSFVPLDAPLLKAELAVSYRSSQATGVLASFLQFSREAFAPPPRSP